MQQSSPTAESIMYWNKTQQGTQLPISMAHMKNCEQLWHTTHREQNSSESSTVTAVERVTISHRTLTEINYRIHRTTLH